MIGRPTDYLRSPHKCNLLTPPQFLARLQFEGKDGVAVGPTITCPQQGQVTGTPVFCFSALVAGRPVWMVEAEAAGWVDMLDSPMPNLTYNLYIHSFIHSLLLESVFGA